MLRGNRPLQVTGHPLELLSHQPQHPGLLGTGRRRRVPPLFRRQFKQRPFTHHFPQYPSFYCHPLIQATNSTNDRPMTDRFVHKLSG